MGCGGVGGRGRGCGCGELTCRRCLRDDRLLLVGQDGRCSVLGDVCRAGVVDTLAQLQQGHIAIVCHHVQVVPGQMHAPLHTTHLRDHAQQRDRAPGQGKDQVEEQRGGGGVKMGMSTLCMFIWAVLVKSMRRRQQCLQA